MTYRRHVTGPDFLADNRNHKGILSKEFRDYKIIKKGWRSRL